MAKYWQKRPVFEAVQLKPENAKKIKEMVGCAEVGFSDNCCFFTFYSRPQQENQTSWLVTEPNYSVKVLSDSEFNEIFEPVERKK